jgi:hypothetical protein
VLRIDPVEPLALLLITSVEPGEHERRLRSVVYHGRRLGIAVVVLGPSPIGPSVVVEPGGRLVAPEPGGPLEALAEGHLFVLPDLMPRSSSPPSRRAAASPSAAASRQAGRRPAAGQRGPARRSWVGTRTQETTVPLTVVGDGPGVESMKNRGVRESRPTMGLPRHPPRPHRLGEGTGFLRSRPHPRERRR